MYLDPAGNYHAERPQRIRLQDLTTRTAEAITDELLISEGWTLGVNPPVETVPEPAPGMDTLAGVDMIEAGEIWLTSDTVTGA